ncbi:MAG: hypothetical protein ACK4UP_03205 [Spirosomataceae bacterium]
MTIKLSKVTFYSKVFLLSGKFTSLIVGNGANAIPLILSNNDPQVTPTIGFVVEF